MGSYAPVFGDQVSFALDRRGPDHPGHAAALVRVSTSCSSRSSSRCSWPSTSGGSARTAASQGRCKETAWHKSPNNILRRSAEARAKKEGRPVDEILAEMKGEAPAPAEPSAAATPSPAAAPAAPSSNGRDLAAESEATGVPVPLLERAMLARAKPDGIGRARDRRSSRCGRRQRCPRRLAPLRRRRRPGVPMEPRSDRLLTVIRAGDSPADQVSARSIEVTVWPHLLAIEFVALLSC